MDEAFNVDLEQEIIAELTIELQEEPTFNADILAVKVKSAIREVRAKRNYEATKYTDEQIEKDLYRFYSNIKNIALYDYNQIGSEGEQSHSDISVSRTWVSRDDLFNGIYAFASVI